MTADEANEQVKRIDEHVNALMEFFDSVQIFASKEHEDRTATRTFTRGSGNWCARYGQIREWVDYQVGRTHEEGTQAVRDERKD